MANCYFCYQPVPDGGLYHPPCCKKVFGTSKLPELKLDQSLLKSLAEQTVNQRIAVTGVQPKLSMSLVRDGQDNRLTIVGLWGNFILKPQHSSFSQMPENEDLTMHLASVFRVSTCRHCLLRASDGNLVYLAKRFDREGQRKIHMEDFCQLAGFQTEQKYSSSYEHVGRLIRQYCSNRGLDLQRYFELLLFCFITGNNDMHLKNFSVLHQDKEIILSPAYDLINSAIINKKDKQDVGLKLNGKDKELKRHDFIQLGKALQLPDLVVQRALKKFTSKDEEILEWISRSFLSPDGKQEYKELYTRKVVLLR
ncbi:HipA domain-containing protein [Desertivirga arenae]|uniref:HipA domain-containing protein n=1 Tax=Desertivirga arenae TaxID=2810309 RepID=UPI001A96B180|nr:HipA domain-containing protein [Pedobacter sp. SYSU D00823]